MVFKLLHPGYGHRLGILLEDGFRPNKGRHFGVGEIDWDDRLQFLKSLEREVLPIAFFALAEGSVSDPSPLLHCAESHGLNRRPHRLQNLAFDGSWRGIFRVRLTFFDPPLALEGRHVLLINEVMLGRLTMLGYVDELPTSTIAGYIPTPRGFG